MLNFRLRIHHKLLFTTNDATQEELTTPSIIILPKDKENPILGTARLLNFLYVAADAISILKVEIVPLLYSGGLMIS